MKSKRLNSLKIEDQFSHILTLEEYEKERTLNDFVQWVEWVTQSFLADEQISILYHNKGHRLIKRFVDEAIGLSFWINSMDNKADSIHIVPLSGDQKMDAIFIENGVVKKKIEITHATDYYSSDKCNSEIEKIEIIKCALLKKLSNNYEAGTVLIINCSFIKSGSDEELKQQILVNFKNVNITPFSEVFIMFPKQLSSFYLDHSGDLKQL